jgi:proprotein convertase subtilisin/kexin type 5
MQATSQCITCSIGTYYNSSTINCQTCNSSIQYCLNCNSNSNCITCGYSLIFTSGSCLPNCIYSQCTACSFSIPTGIICTSCNTGYVVSIQDQTLCTTVCGDGIVMSLFEQCDDGNTMSGDGCSSFCIVESLFTCSNTTNSPSKCLLSDMNISTLCIIKD